jgi:hypothetical protein
MAKDFQIIHLTIDEGLLKKAGNRLRNQLVGCMHAHNELAILNRILMFSMNDTGAGELHNSAHSVQLWCVLQILAAKLVEARAMLNERFLRASPPDAIIAGLKPEHKASLDWLDDYFGIGELKDNALKIIRDKTAFHYDRLNLDETMSNLAVGENSIYLAEHPANSLYFMGSALVFRAAFAMIADRAQQLGGAGHENRVREGMRIAMEDASQANWHMHLLLYGLIEILLEEVLGHPLENLDQVRINVLDAPAPEKVGIPTFIDIG